MAEIQVTAPQPVTADIAGVSFRKGEATADSVRDRRALSYFRRHGYTVETVRPEPKTKAKAKADPKPPQDPNGSFDPSGHDVPEVLAYLDSLSEDEAGQAERERVLAAEAEGKNRKTITEKGGASS
ncbi:hypothetical protein [Streptomyces marianii]|uniref:Uncharacterized protein n=1 Tax=Streptomyces marianii TaxID=1817406 RepID=A0A5R9E0L5_9ACTN|nr:hypothetical protein [Streptomyces marianii]TLQ43481.1 hypothetical protein FEF34_10280 [Streptomyces marianii]